MTTLRHPDLFPKTLLVECDHGEAYTTSLKVAEHFRKKHKNVLQAIQRLLAECPDKEFSGLNFQPANYHDAQKKPREMYHLTHDGFALLAMGFTGKEALHWKIDFLNAFRTMEAQLRAQADREARALHWLRPHWRLIGQGVAEGLSRREIIARTGHRSPESVTRNKARMRQAGLLD